MRSPLLARLLRSVIRTGRAALRTLGRCPAAATQPGAAALIAGALADPGRGKPELLAEDAPLRQRPLVLRRGVTRPRCSPTDRAVLVPLASRVRAWRQAPLIVQPGTPLRWHRELFRRRWGRKSRAAREARRAKVPAGASALIRELARANPVWGAERIRGELPRVGIRAAKWAVQKYPRAARPPRRAGQSWATFPRNHADASWARDSLPITDARSRPVYAFFVSALGSRRVVPAGVPRHPTDAQVAQQLRAATPFEQRPRYLIRDTDSKSGREFARVAEASGSAILRTAYRAPRQNATRERCLRSVRRACLDRPRILGEAHLRRVPREDVACFNGARPHQGRQRRIPVGTEEAVLRPQHGGPIQAVPA